MALAVLQAAQEFAFLSPSFDQQITPGQAVTVFQGPDSSDGYETQILAANATQDTNTVEWIASSAPGNDFSIPFLFRLQKGDLPNDCALCTSISSAFQVVDPNASVPDTTSPSGTPTETAEMMPTATTPIAEATTSPSTDSASDSTMAMATSTEEGSSATSATESTATPTESSTDTAAAATATSSSESTAAPMKSTPASESTPAATSSSTSPTAAGASAIPTSSTEFQNVTEQNWQAPSKETLALGLGIGIPIGLSAIGMIAFLLWDEKRKQKQHRARWDVMNSDEEK
ncbi:hypothetical protein CLAFUW4_07651 [Fulvia fulva]|uniref:Uncharacterized protein n=1 Tax=Passalora fulva TaxID=5499 RepID=A0A9Q8LEM2_PASFU|nr:uncharacterized protein CLAFUR5_07779 [Fulvia fulva]KAK4629733.1 hypothetical protein CLAFUR4_07656 [Fulvia fulva]KAK4630087.1 hypothetical protein CLAFUR0_07656 [Fulvia fulva]UJO15278.1 hypothetical protein CLAFUR5_07779 [Fulvia fulva]WPV12386.1 hypothetical protein CLAFUW4_07651 [Fulvia fulva]WPV27966.1 hypothetical protein CLAFUW7_07652 [Fulvia fulva]